MEDPINNEETSVNSTGRVELLVATKGVCFLCLQEIPTSTDSSAEVQEVCLRNICRYLEINTHTILKDALIESLQSLPENLDKWDFSVMMCTQCAGITEKLSELIRRLEITTMLTNDKIRELHGILKRSGDSSSEIDSGNKWNQIKEEMRRSNEGNRVELQLVETLRQEAANKCLAKVQYITETSYPKVCLEKLKTVPTPRLKYTTNEEEKPEVANTSLSTASNISLANEPSITKFVTKIASQNFQKLSGKQFRCLKCRIAFAGVSAPKDHLVSIHPEIFFLHLKLPEITEEEFALCCKHVLKLESGKAKQLFKSGSGNVALECPFCKLKCCHGQHLRYHLVVRHFKVLEAEINTFQRDKDLCNVIKTTKSKSHIQALPTQKIISDIFKSNYRYLKAGNQFRCLLCKKNYPGTNARGHLIRDHTSKLFASCKSESVEDEHFNLICQSILQDEIKKAKYTPRTAETKLSFQCRYCSKVLCHRNHLRQHLVTIHYEELRENVLRLQEFNDIIKIMKKQNTFTTTVLKKKLGTPVSLILSGVIKISFLKLPSGKESKCLICGHVLYKSLNHRQHILSKHPEKLFVDNKVEEINDEQFNRCCRYIITEEINRVKAKKRVGKQKLELDCAFCDVSLRNKSHLNWHLVMQHYAVLKEKLDNFQQQVISGEAEVPMIKKKRQVISDVNRKYFEAFKQGDRLKCMLCQEDLRNSVQGQWYHLLRNHPGKCFRGKLENLSEEAFSECCSQVLFQFINQAKCIKNNSAKHDLQCPFCKFESSQRQHLRYHLFRSHYEQLEVEIRKVQLDEWKEENVAGIRKRQHNSTTNAGRNNQRSFKKNKMQLEEFEESNEIELESEASYQFENPGNIVLPEEPDNDTVSYLSNQNILDNMDMPMSEQSDDEVQTNEYPADIYNATHTKVEYWVQDEDEDASFEDFTNETVDSEHLSADNTPIVILSCSSYQHA